MSDAWARRKPSRPRGVAPTASLSTQYLTRQVPSLLLETSSIDKTHERRCSPKCLHRNHQAVHAPTGTWSADPVHSNVSFEIAYAGVNTFRGSFSEFSATLARRHARGLGEGREHRREGRAVERPPPDPRLLRRGAEPGDHLPRDRARRRERHGELTIKGVTKPVELTGDRRRSRTSIRSAASASASSSRPRSTARVRRQLERAQPERRQLPRRRREAHGRARVRQGGGVTMRILGVSGSHAASRTTRSSCAPRSRPRRRASSSSCGTGWRDVPLYDQDLETTEPIESVRRLREAWGSADAMLFATPEYNGSVPGVPEERDRLGVARPSARRRCTNRTVSVIGASNGQFGAMWAQADLRQILGIAGARVVGDECRWPAPPRSSTRGTPARRGALRAAPARARDARDRGGPGRLASRSANTGKKKRAACAALFPETRLDSAEARPAPAMPGGASRVVPYAG